MKMNRVHEKEHWRLPVSRKEACRDRKHRGNAGFSGFAPSRRAFDAYSLAKAIPENMMIHTLTTDPAVALELGRRMAANAKRQPRLRHRLGAVWSRLFNERSPVVPRARSHS